jgi:transcriptional regulator with XRE-family HTH domain
MKKYAYNYDFLRKWIEKSGVKKAQIVKALGIKDKTNLDKWLGCSREQREQRERGEDVKPMPIPIWHIISLCNEYRINIERFFTTDEEKDIEEIPSGSWEIEKLRLELRHQQEMERLRREYQKREDALQQRYDNHVRMMHDIVNSVTAAKGVTFVEPTEPSHAQIKNIKKHKPQTDDYSGAWMVAEDIPDPDSDK